MDKIEKGLLYLFEKACVTALKISKILKRYTGIETPIYKVWWESHVNMIQRKLDAERAARIKREEDKNSQAYHMGMPF